MANDIENDKKKVCILCSNVCLLDLPEEKNFHAYLWYSK